MSVMDAIDRAVRLKKSTQKDTYPTSKGELEYKEQGVPRMKGAEAAKKAAAKRPAGVSHDVKSIKDRQSQKRKAARDVGGPVGGY